MKFGKIHPPVGFPLFSGVTKEIAYILNLMERWFRELAFKGAGRGSFSSVAGLQNGIAEFLRRGLKRQGSLDV